MNRAQNLAWFNLIVITTTIAVSVIATAIEINLRGYSTIGFWVFALLLASLKLKPYLFKKTENKVLFDERDNLIQKRALSFAYTTFWWVFLISSFSSFLIIGPKNSVPTITLPIIVIGGALFIKIVCSIDILVQYSS